MFAGENGRNPFPIFALDLNLFMEVLLREKDDGVLQLSPWKHAGHKILST